ncbi:MAG: hypothetical protein KF883_02135 [Thermomicrobiales bacterium]|nr:hypothetical protein [Thermomicrobiales bacterium]
MTFPNNSALAFWRRRCVVAVTTLLLILSGVAQGASAQVVEPTFTIDPGVAEHDAGFAIEGIRLAQDFFVNRLGADISMPLHVTVLPTADGTTPGRIAVTDEDRITVFTGSDGWTQTSPAERYAVIVHEYTHFYQFLLLREHNFDSPAWFDEGVAEFLSAVAMSEWGVIRQSELEDYWGTILALAPPDESLSELEDWRTYQQSEGAVYPLSYFAVAALFPDTTDLSPISTIYTLMGAGQSFDTAFTLAFGFTPGEHYARMEQELATLTMSSNISDDILVFDPIERVTQFRPTNIPVHLVGGEQVIVEGTALPASVCAVSFVDAVTGETLVERTTFADGTGDVYWFVTVPDGAPGTLISIDMACGGEPVERVAVLTG